MKNVGNSRRHSQGVPKIFMAPMCGAHCAVIFAIAQLSCIQRKCLVLEISSVLCSQASIGHSFLIGGGVSGQRHLS